MTSQITPCLWFNGEAEEAAKFYTSVFKDGAITKTSYFTETGKENHSFAPGSVMMVAFTINGTSFTALNGGPHFKHSEAVSFQISCKDQEEVDYYWEKLKEGGDERKQDCGWVGDRFGISWQVIPVQLIEYISAGGERGERAMKAMLSMKKMDIEALRKAFEGEA
ncbi:putative 3-demethylubiquinone-9 3-methyltransferase [Tricladium varicosporioides]|nr:putative 3-demethylubiquinone-9 3-methyltransferase [Hymenoscyphus varicosporioides]